MGAVVVYGATGHTGRFVVEELLRRGLSTVISGRDATTLETLASKWGDIDVRPAAVDDPHSLDEALKNAAGRDQLRRTVRSDCGAGDRGRRPGEDPVRRCRGRDRSKFVNNRQARPTRRLFPRWRSTVDSAIC